MLVPITDAEVPRMVALINQAYRGVAEGWNTEAGYIAGSRTTEDLLRSEIADRPGAALLKWQDAGSGEIQGCVWVEPLGDDVWYLGTLTIISEQQNSGLGRTVLFAAEDWAWSRGAKLMRMTVINVRDVLIGWYERRGYRQTGETAPFPYNDARFGTPLRDDLHFVVLEKIF